MSKDDITQPGVVTQTLGSILKTNNMKYLLRILIFQVVLSTSFVGQCQKALWNQKDLSDISVLLYRKINDSSGLTGTGTIIHYEDRYFLLTASHVSKNMDSISQVVFSIGNDKPLIKDFKKLTLDRNITWYVHDTADIALIELKIPDDTLLENRYIKLAFPINQIYSGTVLPSRSSDITFFGYPVIDLELEHFSALTFTAYLCSGLITQKRGDTKKKSTFFYLNTPSIEGCSGSGVFYSVSKEMYIGGDKTILIGIMHGTYSDSTGGKMAAVTPSFYIFDLLK